MCHPIILSRSNVANKFHHIFFITRVNLVKSTLLQYCGTIPRFSFLIKVLTHRIRKKPSLNIFSTPLGVLQYRGMQCVLLQLWGLMQVCETIQLLKSS